MKLRYLRQCPDQTHHSDFILVQVGYQQSTWSSRWEWGTFHDYRLPEPRVGSWNHAIGEFVTVTAPELVMTSTMTDHDYDFRWPIEAFDDAREFARRLRDYGQWAHAWTNKHNWPQHDRRGERLRVRLVRQQIAKLTREIDI